MDVMRMKLKREPKMETILIWTVALIIQTVIVILINRNVKIGK